ncbi:MAG: FtsB family cell division protein [Erysipelotrichaceae bacterium]
MVKQKKKFKLGELIITLTVLAVSCFFLYESGKDIFLTNQLNQQVAASTAQLNELESEAKILENQIEKLQDPEYVKIYARGEYTYSKDGEQIFQLDPSSSTVVEKTE